MEERDLGIKQWWPRLAFEAKSHLKSRLHEPLDMASLDALVAAGVVRPGEPLRLQDDDWTWIEQYG